jgi:phage-related holin
MNNYLVKFCDIDLLKAGVATCTAIIITIFGEDHTAITIAFWLYMLDTATGAYLAKIKKQFESKKLAKMIEKGVVMFVLFLAVALLGVLYPDLSHLVIYLPTLVAVNEAYSIVENVHKIRPTLVTQTILDLFGAVKEKAINQLTKK